MVHVAQTQCGPSSKGGADAGATDGMASASAPRVWASSGPAVGRDDIVEGNRVAAAVTAGVRSG